MKINIKSYMEGLVTGRKHSVFYLTKIPTFFGMPQNNYIKLFWLYPQDGSVTSVQIRRSLTRYPQDISDGTLIYNGDGISFNDLNVSTATTYYYRIFYYDINNNLVDSFTTCSATTTSVTRYKLYFDGISTKVTIPNDSNNILYSLFATGNYTIIIKLNKFSDNSLDGHNPSVMMQLWYSSGYSYSNAFLLWAEHFHSANEKKIYFSLENNSDKVFSVIADNSNSEYKVSLFESGNLLNSDVGVTSMVGSTSYPLTLGSLWTGVSHFYGTIQEVQIWNRALSDTENLFYSEYSPIGNEDGLLLYYDFSEGSGITLNNKGSLGSACNGTISGITKYSTTVPTYQYILVYSNSGYYYSITSNHMLYYDTSTGLICTAVATGWNKCKYNANNNTWIIQESGGSGGAFNIISFSGSTMVYSNYDIMDQQNALYFKGNIDTNTWQLA